MKPRSKGNDLKSRFAEYSKAMAPHEPDWVYKNKGTWKRVLPGGMTEPSDWVPAKPPDLHRNALYEIYDAVRTDLPMEEGLKKVKELINLIVRARAMQGASFRDRKPSDKSKRLLEALTKADPNRKRWTVKDAQGVASKEFDGGLPPSTIKGILKRNSLLPKSGNKKRVKR